MKRVWVDLTKSVDTGSFDLDADEETLSLEEE